MDDADALLAHDRFLRSLAGALARPGEDPEDAVQDAYAAALASPPPRRRESHRAWLGSILRNAFLGRRRAEARRRARESAAAVPETGRPRGPGEARRRAVVEAVLALDAPYRETILLLYLDGLPPREAAARLGVPVETVKTRRKRGLALVRAALQRGDDDDLPWLAAFAVGSGELPAAAARTGTPAVVVKALLGAAAAAAVATTAIVATRPEARPVSADASPDGGAPGMSWGPGGGGEGEVAGGAAGRAERVSSRIRVIDAAGRPVAGARILLATDPRFPDDFSWTATGADGRPADKRLPTIEGSGESGLHVAAWVPGAGASDWASLAGDGPVDLVLGPGGTVDGRVTDDESGIAVAGAEVELHLGPEYGSDNPRRVRADASGRFLFDAVPPGTLLHARPVEDFRASVATDDDLGRGSRQQWIDAIPPGRVGCIAAQGGHWTRDLTARRRAGVEAVFRWRLDGTPEGAGASVTQEWGDERESRRERRALVPGTTSWNTFLPAGSNRVWCRVDAWCSLPLNEPVTGDGPPRERELVLRRGPRVLVQALGDDGTPLRRAGLTLLLGTRNHASGVGKSGADGVVDLTPHLPAPDEDPDRDRHLVLLWSGEGIAERDLEFPNLAISWAETSTVLAARSHADPLVLAVPAPSVVRIPVRVVDAAGNPAAGVRVEALQTPSGEREEAVDVMTSGPDGALALELRGSTRLPDGGLRALAPWVGSVDDDALREARGGLAPALLRVEPLRAVRVLVRDEDDRPLAGARAAVGERDVLLDDAGGATVELAASATKVSVVVAHHHPGHAAIAGDGSPAIVRLRRRHVATVRVVAADPAAAPGDVDLIVRDVATGARLGSHGGPGIHGPGDDAVFEVEVPAEGVRVEAWAGNGEFSADGVVARGATLVLALRKTEWRPVAVRVVGLDGAPRGPLSLSVYSVRNAISVALDEAGVGEIRLPPVRLDIYPSLEGAYIGGWPVAYTGSDELVFEAEPLRRLEVLVPGFEPQGASLAPGFSAMRSGFHARVLRRVAGGTDTPGRFTVEAPRGGFTLAVAWGRDGERVPLHRFDIPVPEGVTEVVVPHR